MILLVMPSLSDIRSLLVEPTPLFGECPGALSVKVMNVDAAVIFKPAVFGYCFRWLAGTMGLTAKGWWLAMTLVLGWIIGLVIPALILALQVSILIATGEWHWLPFIMFFAPFGLDETSLARAMVDWHRLTTMIVLWTMNSWAGVPFMAVGYAMIWLGSTRDQHRRQ